MAAPKITCCQRCDNRKPSCHGTCETYAAQRAARDQYNAGLRMNPDKLYYTYSRGHMLKAGDEYRKRKNGYSRFGHTSKGE